MKRVATIGLDLAEQIFQVHGADADGSRCFQPKTARGEVLRFFEKQSSCLVGIEACGSSHYWAREITALGHQIRLMPPAHVKAFVKRGKTDAADAEAISEAVTRKTMRFVPVKSVEQQAAAIVLKTRTLLVRQQTQAIISLTIGPRAGFGDRGSWECMLSNCRYRLYSFKLRLAIALKGSSIEGREPPGGSYRSAEFRNINPAGTIPVLVDGDFILAESDAIIEYLDDARIGSPLLPSDPKKRARTRMLSRWCDLRLEAAVRSLFPMIKSPEPDRARIAATDARIAAALELLEQSLDKEGPFSLGARPGLVDCGLVAIAMWLEGIRAKLNFSAEPGPKLARTIEAMLTHQATDEMIQSHRLSIARCI